MMTKWRIVVSRVEVEKQMSVPLERTMVETGMRWGAHGTTRERSDSGYRERVRMDVWLGVAMTSLKSISCGHAIPMSQDP